MLNKQQDQQEAKQRCGACGMIIGSKQACCQPWTYDSELDRCVNHAVKAKVS